MSASPCPARWRFRRRSPWRSTRSSAGTPRYDGYVALGCVIRGETTHYDIVAGESAARRSWTWRSTRRSPLGNGILTVENDEQAWARARVGEQNKGGAAAEAALAHDRAPRALRPER